MIAELNFISTRMKKLENCVCTCVNECGPHGQGEDNAGDRQRIYEDRKDQSTKDSRDHGEEGHKQGLRREEDLLHVQEDWSRAG